MKEIWKNINGFDGYQVSNLGNVRTHNKVTYTKRHGERHWKDRTLKQKWSRSTARKDRYDARVNLWKNGRPYTFLVARLVATAFLGESDLTVNHIDGDTRNNKIDNLEWVTREENIKKAFKRGLYESNNKQISLKINQTIYTFCSQTKASLFIGRNKGYINACLKSNKNIFTSSGLLVFPVN